jgi:ACDE family multidrug resistance protein
MSDDDVLGRERSVYRDRNLQVIFGVSLMGVLGVSSITPAFPSIVKELGISPQAVGSLITVFTLPGVILTPVVGVLSDQWGRKRILIPALFLFAGAGTACALARDFQLLLILRFLQGTGAAALGALNLTILGDLYVGKERAEAMGCNSSMLSAGTAGYPAIGGALATLGWHYPFLLPLAAIPVALAVVFFLESPEPKNSQQLGQYLRDALRIIWTRQVLALFVVSIGTFLMLYGSYLTYLPLLIEESFSLTPFAIGVIISISSVAAAATSSQVGRLATLCPEWVLIAVACILYAVGLLMMPMIPHPWMFVLPTTLYGIAGGLNMPSLVTLLASRAPMEQRGILMSINGMVFRLGQTLGPMVMGMLFGLSGFGGVFIGGAACGVLMFSMVVTLMR